MIKFTSNVFSLLAISGIALLVQAVLGAADTDDDGSLLFDPSGILPPALWELSGLWVIITRHAWQWDWDWEKAGKQFCLVSPHPEPQKGRPQLELWKHLSMTKGSGTGLGQIKRGAFIFTQLVPCKMWQMDEEVY